MQKHKSANEHLKQENESLTHQQAWFKQQLFCEKSEKRLIKNPEQLALGEILRVIESAETPETETGTLTSGRKLASLEGNVSKAQHLRSMGGEPLVERFCSSNEHHFSDFENHAQD